MPPPGALDAASSSTAVDTQAASAVASAHSAAQQIRSIFASLNLAAEGRQAMESFASGVRDGTASAVAAANSAAARVKAAAGSGRVNLNTGPAMGAGVP